MEVMQQIKDYTTLQIIRKITSLLGKISDSRLIQLTYLGEKLAPQPDVKRSIQQVRFYVQNGYPAKDLFYRVLNYLGYESQVKLFHTLPGSSGGKNGMPFQNNMGINPLLS